MGTIPRKKDYSQQVFLLTQRRFAETSNEKRKDPCAQRAVSCLRAGESRHDRCVTGRCWLRRSSENTAHVSHYNGPVLSSCQVLGTLRQDGSGSSTRAQTSTGPETTTSSSAHREVDLRLQTCSHKSKAGREQRVILFQGGKCVSLVSPSLARLPNAAYVCPGRSFSSL